MHSHMLKDAISVNETTFCAFDSGSEICPDAHCPHRAALKRERLTSMQLVAANRVLEEGRRNLLANTERLEAEMRVKKQMLMQVGALASREASRREELEKEVAQLQRTISKRCLEAECTAAAKTTEMEGLQRDVNVLMEQVVQLQVALEEMVQFNRTLQSALRSSGAESMRTAAGARSCEVPAGTQHAPDVPSSLPASSLLLSSSSPSSAAISAEVNRSAQRVREEGHVNDDRENTDKSSWKSEAKAVTTPDDNGSQGADSETALSSMRNAVSELAALRAFLNSLPPES